MLGLKFDLFWHCLLSKVKYAIFISFAFSSSSKDWPNRPNLPQLFFSTKGMQEACCSDNILFPPPGNRY